MIISIGRECGSGGHEIGKKLAQHYGINYYDENILGELAKRGSFDPNDFSKTEEKVTGKFFHHHSGSFSAENRDLADSMSKSDQLFLMEKDLIEELARKESFVIVGRAAEAILKDDPNTLRIFVYAEEDFRLPRVKEYFHLLTNEEARKQMLKIDKQRKEYFNYYTDEEWGSRKGHDFMIDSSLLGVDETVEAIIAIADKKF